jgi:hypothetical protein
MKSRIHLLLMLALALTLIGATMAMLGGSFLARRVGWHDAAAFGPQIRGLDAVVV